MKLILPEYSRITRDNVKSISKRLRSEGGMVLVATPRYASSPANVLWGDFEINLFHSPTVSHDGKGNFEIMRGKRGDNNRDYSLRPVPPPSTDSLWNAARDLFTSLAIGEKYLFQINPSSTSYMSLGEDRGQLIYVPHQSGSDDITKGAFMSALIWMTDLWNDEEPRSSGGEKFRFIDDHIVNMVDYVMEDLRTGAMLAHNTQAGRDADVMVGLGPVS